MRERRSSTIKLCAFQNDKGVHCADAVKWFLHKKSGDYMFVCDNHFPWGARKCGAPLYIEEYDPMIATLILEGKEDGEV